MNVAEVAQLLRTRIGLDVQSLGSDVLPSAVANRMRVLGLRDAESYGKIVAASAAEFDALVDNVVVPETWFFRGGPVFAFLAEHVRDRIAAIPSIAYRMLSAPCSTGEEPYSLAIALSDAGVPGQRWTLDGIDVSSRSLERARRARYGESSFRETPADVRSRHFHPVEGGWELDSALKNRVRFRQGNLLDPHLLASEGTFDLIFCRNLLIYLDAPARRRVLDSLDRLLSPDGLLCMGHAEPWSLIEERFQATGPNGYFLFQRQTESDPRRNKRLEPPRDAVAPAPSRPRKVRLRSEQPMAPPSRNLLAQAREEADAGALDAALRSCQAHLAAAGPSADTYTLLGIIHQARRERQEAADAFRKALYLDPQHAEALLHLMLMQQEDGNEAEASQLRRRLERHAAGGKP